MTKEAHVKSRSVVSALCALSLVALSGLAKEPRWAKQPGTPVTLESSGFELRATLPHGWSHSAKQGLVPPPALAPSCRVSVDFHTDGDWDRFLVAALRSTERMSTASDARTVMKAGGRPAVLNRYARESVAVREVYVDLSDLQPGSGVVWKYEGSSNTEGWDCELQFFTTVHSAAITRK
jgi:hypothetical protein